MSTSYNVQINLKFKTHPGRIFIKKAPVLKRYIQDIAWKNFSQLFKCKSKYFKNLIKFMEEYYFVQLYRIPPSNVIYKLWQLACN